MDGIHDLGGMQGFGPVEDQGADEPPFHHPWEGRVHGMMISLGANRALPGSFRYAIERMGAVQYLTTSYYEHWMAAIETLLDEQGVVSRGTLAQRIEQGRAEPEQRLDPELAQRAKTALTAPSKRVWRGPDHRFTVGQKVRAKKDATTHSGHTRCPRYVRDVVGVIERLCPLEPLPEGLPTRDIQPVPLYTVCFHSHDLWGEDAEDFTLRIDLVEPYLEEV
jgi:nitrile hydratase